ncbi:MAG: imelysin family protein [Bacteroidota bacterium]
MVLAKTILPTHLSKLFYFATLAGLILALSSCDDDDESNIPASDFDRTAMLQSLAEGLIVPNFEELDGSLTTLSNNATSFIENTNEENLISLREAWVQAVVDHQHCSAFGFGPGDLTLGDYARVLGAYPADTEQIEVNINNPNFDLPNSFDTDVRGFYTIEYLIYGNGSMTDQEVIASFDENRKNYLSLILSELTSTISSVVSEWKNGYLQEFLSSDGTSLGSSTQLVFNGFVKDYENIKNFKLELPGGLIAGEIPAPNLVEAFYSGISTQLIRENWENTKNIYFGRTREGSEITGWDSYLNDVVGGSALVASTIDSIAGIDSDMMQLPGGRLSENIEDPSIEKLVNSLQNNTANFKSSITSLLGVEVSFNSGDGD